MVHFIEDWRGSRIPIVYSRGGKAVAVNFEDALISNQQTWPPAEIVQKLYAAERLSSFEPDDHPALTRRLGFYCDLQSLRSEDSITWSYFGPLMHSALSVRQEFGKWLSARLGFPPERSPECEIWLWRRTLHPEKPSAMGGPEIDVGIRLADTVIFGEAKWNASVGKNQGVAKDKTQLDLRRDYFLKFGRKVYPGCQRFIVLGIGQDHFASHDDTLGDGFSVLQRSITWAELAAFPQHPCRAEFSAYARWKQQW